MLRVSRFASARTLPSLAARASAVQMRPAVVSRMYSAQAKPDGEADAASGAEAGAAEGGEAEPAKSEWQVKFEAKDKEAAKLKEAYQRSVADFRNLQNTTQQEVKKSQQFALQKFAKDLIESVDNFDLAIRAYPKEKLTSAPKEVQEFYTGVAMVQQVLEKTLSKHGIVKVNPMNEKFDPNEHEALYQIPQEGTEPGTIVHVDRTGFKLFDRVLRAPKVGFVKDPSE